MSPEGISWGSPGPAKEETGQCILTSTGSSPAGKACCSLAEGKA